MGFEDLSKIFQSELETLVPKAVKELLEPVLLLKDKPDILTAEDVAEIIGERESKRVYEYCYRNEIPHFHYGRNIRVARPQLIKYLLGEKFNKCKICEQKAGKSKTTEKAPEIKFPNKKLLKFASR